MASIWFDHFISYAGVVNIDDYVQEYAEAGFLPDDMTVRHDPGLRNGYIHFGPEYVEFCWVEDEDLFAKADAQDKLFRKALRPFGIGMITEDVQQIHDDWTARGYVLPEVWSKTPRDATPGTPPAWSFQEFPEELLRGVSCFALTYHTRPRDEARKIRISPNTIYGISGVTFVTQEPEARAASWRNLLAPGEQVAQSGPSFDVRIGPHQAMWMTPDAFHSTYGFNWMPSLHPFGELSVLDLLASDLAIARQMLEQAGRQVLIKKSKGIEELLIAPDGRDGFAYSVRQQPVDVWLAKRMARTGEKLKLAHD